MAMQAQAQDRQPQELNGWDLEAFAQTVETVKQQPETGKVTWRTKADWDAGFGVDAHTTAIEQAGQVLQRKFTLRGDHPPQLLGENTGPTAVETLLAALGSCIAGTYAAHATARGVKLDELEVELESRIDLNGFLQLRPTTPGLQGVEVKIRVKSDADPATLEELREVATSASPVHDTISRPVDIHSRLEQVR